MATSPTRGANHGEADQLRVRTGRPRRDRRRAHCGGRGAHQQGPSRACREGLARGSPRNGRGGVTKAALGGLGVNVNFPGPMPRSRKGVENVDGGPPPLDEAKLEAFMGKVVEDLSGTMTTFFCSI